MRLLAGLLAAAALLSSAACDGGDDTPQGTPLPSGRTAAPTAPKGASEASKLASKFLAGVDGKYEYLYKGQVGTVTEATLTIYRLGVNDRQDWKATSSGIESTTISIMAADNNYLCIQAENLNNCQVSSVPELEALRVVASPIYNALAALAVEPDKFEVDDLPDETFAGITGKCYHAFSETRIGQGPPSSEEIKACFTEEGAILYFQRTTTPDSAAIAPGTVSIDLQVAGDALPTDFEPTGRLP